MKVVVNSMSGFEDAFVAMFISKRTWTQELDRQIRDTCDAVLDKHGHFNREYASSADISQFNKWLTLLL